ncbi:MAG: UDP-glucose 4-epimerase GalE [Candidatus Omnitrophota bacterium]
MTILLTGGAGYIGSHTAVALKEAGHRPVIIDNYSNSRPEALDGLRAILGTDITAHKGDCRDAAFLDRVFKEEGPIHGVIHFAALKAVGESLEKPDLYRDNNNGSLAALIKAMADNNCPHLVFSSSACVYGVPETLPVTEETPLQPPESTYGETKQTGEKMTREAVETGKIKKAVSLRYFNPVGAHPSGKIGEYPIGTPNNLIPLVTQTAAGWHDQLTIFGNDWNTPDGTPIRDYIHVMDLARAHVMALDFLAPGNSHPAPSPSSDPANRQMPTAKCHIPDAKCQMPDANFPPPPSGEGQHFNSPPPSGEDQGGGTPKCQMPNAKCYSIFNLGTGQGNSVLEVVKTFEKVNNVKVPYTIGERRPGDIESLYANADLAEREIGWKAQKTIADALRDSWRWQCTLTAPGS